jgi:hypothetical protein
MIDRGSLLLGCDSGFLFIYDGLGLAPTRELHLFKRYALSPRFAYSK